MLDSPPTCHKHAFLMGYKHVVCNTGGSTFFHIPYRGTLWRGETLANLVNDHKFAKV